MEVASRSADEAEVRAVVVASWFPAVDDTSKGRFIADQVGALRATGLVAPVVVSFQPVRLTGGPIDRRRQAAAVRRSAAVTIRTQPTLFSPAGFSGPAGVPVARLPIPSGGRGIGTPVHLAADRRSALGLVAERLGDARPTVIHAHTGYPDGAAATTLIRPLRAPLIITEHATYLGRQLADRPTRRLYLDAVRRAARVIAVSESLGAELRSAIPECASKVVVLPNAVAIDDFRIAQTGERDPDELLYVGYRTGTKGIADLLTAFARVRSERPATRLRLIGRSPSEETEAGWRRLAEDLGIAAAVRFEGPALRIGVAAAMARASILVHASTRETFGVAPVEALASGLPVVAVDTPPLREILGSEPRRLGALVPPGDPTALAAAILETLGRREEFDPGSLRAAVETRFGAAAVALRLANLYDEVLSEWHAGPHHRPSSAGRWAGAARNDDRPSRGTVLVGFDTSGLVPLVSAIPSAIRSGLRVVCTSDASVGSLPDDLEGVEAVAFGGTEGPPPPSSGRAPRRSRVERGLDYLQAGVRDLGGAGARRLADRQVAGLRRALTSSLTGGSDAASEVICIGGTDYRIAERALGSGGRGRIGPGIRWYADREASRGTRSENT